MAASGSMPWIRSDVTRDDPVWQKDVSGQMKYPPLRFLSRHTPCDPDCPAGYDSRDWMTSGTAISPDDGGSDVSISSADTVIAAASCADKLNNGMRSDEDQRETEIVHVKFADNESQNSGYSNHYINHVESHLCDQEVLPGEYEAGLRDTDDVTSHVTTESQSAAGKDQANGLWEDRHSGNTPYFTVEYADQDDSISSTGSGSVLCTADDKHVPIRRNRNGSENIDFCRSIDRTARSGGRQGVRYEPGPSRETPAINKNSKHADDNSGGESVNTTSHEPNSTARHSTRDAVRPVHDQRAVNAQRLGDTDVSGANAVTNRSCGGALLVNGHGTLSTGPADLVTCEADAAELGVREADNNGRWLYSSSTEAGRDAVHGIRTLIGSEDRNFECENGSGWRREFAEFDASESPMIQSRDELTVCEKRAPDADELTAENPGEAAAATTTTTTTTTADQVRDRSLTARKHLSGSKSELGHDDAAPRMRARGAGPCSGDGVACDGSLPGATVNNRFGMRGMCHAGQALCDCDNSDASSTSGLVVDGSRPPNGVHMEQDEGIGDEMTATIGAVGQHPSVVGIQTAENPSDNSSVDSEGTPYRKKSALKSAASASASASASNRDGGRKRAARKVRFAEPLVMRDSPPQAALSARERLGLGKDSAMTLGNGIVMRPKIQYVETTDVARDDGAAKASEPDITPRSDISDKTPRFIIKRGPPVRRLSGLSATREDNADGVHDDETFSQSSSHSGTGRSTSSLNRSNDGSEGVWGPSDSRESGTRQTTSGTTNPSGAETWYGEPTEDSRVSRQDQGMVNCNGKYSSLGSNPDGIPRRKPKVTLTRSSPITKNRPKPSPELRRRPPSPTETAPTTANSDDFTKEQLPGALSRETPLRRSVDSQQIRYGMYIPNNHVPERDSAGSGSGTTGVPTYVKLGQKVLPSGGVGGLRQVGYQEPRTLTDSGAGKGETPYVRSLSYDDVSKGAMNGNLPSSTYQRNPRLLGGVPELAVIPLQTDSPSVPSPVSGDSGISSSSSVTDLNREQSFGTVTTADGLSDSYNTLNYIRSDKTRSILTQVYETEEPRPDVSVSEAMRHHRPVEREIRETPDMTRSEANRNSFTQSSVVRRTSGRTARRGQVTSATEHHWNSDLDQWSRTMDKAAKDDASVSYLAAGRQQGGARLNDGRNSAREGYSDVAKHRELSPREVMSSQSYHSAGQQQQQQPKGRGVYRDIEYSSYGDSGTGQEEENPYGRFLRSATNRKSTRGKLVPIPMDILNPRPQTEGTADNVDSWSQPYLRSGDDFRRMSNSSGYSTQDVSYDLGPPGSVSRLGYPESAGMANAPGGYASGADSWTDDTSVGRNSLTFEKPEPRFTTTAEIYKLLREKSRNPFVKTNGYT